MLRLLPLVFIATMLALFSCSETEKKEDTPQEVVQEDSVQLSDVVGEEVEYTADSITMKGYIAYDKSIEGKVPGVIVVHEWWGHNDYARKRAKMLADLGYVAFALDMYGNGQQAGHPKDAMAFSSSVMANIDGAKARFDQALATLKANPKVDTSKIAAIGYCFGGSVVLTMANMGEDLDGVAAFHSGVQLPVMPNEKLKAQVLVMNGAEDPFISEESIETFKTDMDSLTIDYKYESLPGAVHAYSNPDADSLGQKFNLPLAYNAKADSTAWAELEVFLTKVFK